MFLLRKMSMQVHKYIQNIVNLAVFLFYDFQGFFKNNGGAGLFQEGVGEIFSGNEEGYGMTLHATNGKPGCISFRFMNFYSQRGSRPSSDAPVGVGSIFFLEKEEGQYSLYMPKITNLTILGFFTSYSSVSWWGPPPRDALEQKVT